MKIRKMVSVLLILCLMAAPVYGWAEGSPATRQIVDHAGNTVEIPAEINRVVITSVTPLPALFCLFMGSSEKLAGMYPASKSTALHSIVAEMIPGLEDISTSFYDGSAINVEELMKLDPDVVFYFAGKEDEKQAIEKAGIPAVAFDPFYDGNNGGDGNNIVAVAREWISLLGEIFDMPGRSEIFESFESEIDALVADRVKNLSEEEKPRTLILANYNEASLMAGGTQTADYWIRAAGGVNVALETGKPMAQINMEQVYLWDPDVIILNSFSAFTVDDILNGATVEGHDWSGLKAVQNKRVYKIPLGTYYWYATCYESPLMTLWMGQTMNPELFSDVDFTAYLKNYFSKSFSVELTDADIDKIFNPSPDAHM